MQRFADLAKVHIVTICADGRRVRRVLLQRQARRNPRLCGRHYHRAAFMPLRVLGRGRELSDCGGGCIPSGIRGRVRRPTLI